MPRHNKFAASMASNDLDYWAETDPDGGDDDEPAPCPVCNGRGKDAAGNKCAACNGTGRIQEDGDEPKENNNDDD
jgi:RecJ-like exonuclease